MAIRIFLTAVLLVCLICVSADAWSRQARPVAETHLFPSSAQSPRTTQSRETEPSTGWIQGAERPRHVAAEPASLRRGAVAATLGAPIAVTQAPPCEGTRLLDRLLTSMNETRWLQLTVVQHSHDPDGGFRSESKLTLGPNDCARAETHIQTGATTLRRLVISDGRVLAEINRRPGEPEKITGFNLPGLNDVAGRTLLLRKLGCVGPLPLLTELRAVVPKWHVTQMKWQERAALRLDGVVDKDHPKLAGRALDSAAACRLILDAESLWPLRLEWRTAPEAQGGQLRLEIDYREVMVDRALSHEECAQAFSYRAADDTRP